MKIDMLPPTSTTIPGNSKETVSQEIKLVNSQQGEKNIVIKIKLSYVCGGKLNEDLVSVSAFPALY